MKTLTPLATDASIEWQRDERSEPSGLSELAYARKYKYGLGGEEPGQETAEPPAWRGVTIRWVSDELVPASKGDIYVLRARYLRPQEEVERLFHELAEQWEVETL